MLISRMSRASARNGKYSRTVHVAFHSFFVELRAEAQNFRDERLVQRHMSFTAMFTIRDAIQDRLVEVDPNEDLLLKAVAESAMDDRVFFDELTENQLHHFCNSARLQT